jgi:hypothetical protein
LKQI